jgi:phytoene synthase
LDPDEYCQQKAAPGGSALHYSLLFVPAERRRAVTALHAFRLEVDAVSDRVADVGVARTKLAWWRTEVADLFAGHPHHPVAKALHPFTAKQGLDAGRLNEIIDGAEMDLTHQRYPDFAALEVYCHRVSGVAEQLCAGMLGEANPPTQEYAERLGIALQLTRIIRDVGEDARYDRLYLPLDELQRFSVAPEEVLARRGGHDFVRLMEFQAERAESLFQDALQRLPRDQRRPQRAGLTSAAIYRTLLAEIRNDGFRVLEQRTALTPLRMLWIAVRA